eukprot:Blabericola_migrator_1__7701@NODE_392_length_9038_cov_131_832349_g80_i1_p11_GENE_NODE_392_length_9038_cov_131_832349_g80_i1NODE_392_length_9038_cov_131_832349_g80_i1_p11_ORF_typecomplete_len101_score10_212OGFeII_Oxy_2/PF13532_6/1_1e11zfRanBP/PF00641_18/0_38zfRanBP/PF00641_18/6_3e02_NODE_392_length_9038_cov_131_832349_g80_i159856287
MEFRKIKNGDDDAICFYLNRRSLCVFAGEARYGWFHGIKSKKTDMIPDDNGMLVVQPRGRRVSLTFRKLNWAKDFKCLNCGYPALCDTLNPASVQLPARL